METIKNIIQSLKNSFESFGQAIVDYLPTLVGALIVLLIGWIISKIIFKIVLKALNAVMFDKLTEKVQLDKLMNKAKISKNISWLIAKFVYWLLMIVFLTSAADILGWTMVSEAIVAILAYLPTLFIALLFLIIGMFLAESIKKMVTTAAESIGVSGAHAIGNIVYYLLMIIVVISAMNQAGIDTSLITSHLTILFASVLVAFALSYGLGAKNIVGNMLSSYYGKGKFEEGQILKIGDTQGEVIQIDNLSITLNANGRKVVYPSSTLIDTPIEIISEETIQIIDKE